MTSRERPTVGLSTTSVFPEPTPAAFAAAASLGYDGVEIMVSGLDGINSDPDALERLRDEHQVPVLAIHAPTLLLTQRTWGTDPWEKLERSARAATQLGADVVVVHPPFRWQVRYGRGFAAGIRRLTETTGVTFCVENMFPWRTPGGDVMAYAPGWDPLHLDYDHLTLDLSHASTSRQQSLELVAAWGERLHHLHLTDGRGGITDEHLLPGYGDQRAADVLEALAERDWRGHAIVEVNTRRTGKERREADLAEALAFTRRHLGLSAS